MGKLIYEDLTFKIRKSLFNVYNTHGTGFREETYKQSVVVDFEQEGVPFEREKTYPIIYRGKEVDEYRVDILVYGKIILELKSVAELHPRFEAQLSSYLKATKLKLGLLVNFGSDELEIRRFVNPHVKEYE
jgi:GxxExxY protein